ncbi:MAG TPA: PAS domain S-box protein [Coleofasciculaceae cyanobacterium]|jgi:PAS domain S-box-containing protein
MTSEIFDQQLMLSQRRLEELWQQANKLREPPEALGQQADQFATGQQELLKESLEELSLSLEELHVLVEELHLQNEELAKSRITLETERQRYKELFELAPDGYLVTTKDGVIIEANAMAAELLNASQKRLVGKPFVVFIGAEERRNFYSQLRQLQRGESIKNWQVQIQRRRGAHFTASATVVPIWDSQDKVVSLRWRVSELTPSVVDAASSSSTQQQKISKAALQEQNLFRAMFEKAAVGIALLDSNGCVIKTNQALQKMVGYREQELQTILPEMMNLDKKGVEFALFQAVMAGQCQSYQLEKRFLCQNTAMQWGRLTFSLVQGSGDEPTFATCLLEDITELRQSEAAPPQLVEQPEVSHQELTPDTILDFGCPILDWRSFTTRSCEDLNYDSNKTKWYDSDYWQQIKSQQLAVTAEQLGRTLNDILSSSPDLFFVINQDGKYIYANRTAAQAFGFSQCDFLGKTWRDLEFPSEIMERFDTQRKTVFRMRHSLSDEASFPTKDGVRDYEYTISPIDGSDRTPEAVVVTLKDITDHKRAVVAANKALAKKEEYSALKSRLVSVVANELRNPITNIFACAKLIEGNAQHWTNETKQDYLQRIQVNVKQIDHLLDDLLLIEKVEAGTLRLKPALIDLAEFCRRLVTELQQGAGREHRITLSTQGKRSGIWDEKLLRQILLKLLLNAIQYSPKGSEINLNVVYQEQQVIFDIQDSGIGITQEDHDLIYRTFYRGRNVGSITGNGLGLAIVKQCVELQRGKIAVDSEVGIGTTFTVTLPLNQRGKRKSGGVGNGQ